MEKQLLLYLNRNNNIPQLKVEYMCFTYIKILKPFREQVHKMM